jgi:DNA repair exonuclease SbcCD ATPase subunit
MIKKIELNNFMSYAHGSAEFNGSTIAVVGENGSGKSAFLEAIPYAYYGISREVKSGLSRIRGDGSHSVTLHDDSGIVIRRGRKESGAGFCEVRSENDGVLISKGKEADAWITHHLGMDGDTFMLTAFFGLSDSHSDSLLYVLPSARLEALQKLAHVGLYKTMLQRVKVRHDAAKLEFEKEKARAEGAESTIENDASLLEGLSAGHKLIAEEDAELKKLKENRHNLQIEEEVYRAFVQEKERVGVERQTLRERIDTAEQEKDGLKTQIKDDVKIIKVNKGDIDEWTAKLQKLDIDDLNTRLETVQKDQGANEASLSLKRDALRMPVKSAECPLCGQSITKDIIEIWKESVRALKVTLKNLKLEKIKIDNDIGVIKDTKDQLSYLDRETKSLCEDIRKAEARLVVVERNLDKWNGELKHKAERWMFLMEKLGKEYQGLQKKLSDVSDSIDESKMRKHTSMGQMKQIKARLVQIKQAQKTVQNAKQIMNKKTIEMQATAILKKAWSRYGIPLQLIEYLNQQIETRASSVYQEFDNGRIEVREVEDRGKPGIQFYLVDRKGDRTFGQLSKGERVMFFIAIRVAIAQIVAEESPITVDYLILDEVMGNLSPKRRDDLIRLLNKILRKIFPQVILVSHTEMRDIFSQTIRITSDDGVSVID